MIFDPIVTRERAFSREMLEFLLQTQFDTHRPMGNVAAHELNSVIKGWLVGVATEVAPVVSRSIQWLETAIRNEEDFGLNRNLHRRTLHWAKAIGEWMELGWESAAWENARTSEEAAWRYEERPWPMNEIIKHGLDDYMAFAYQAGEDAYEAGIQMYERWVGEKPLSLSKVLKPREYAYALCLHEARRQFDRDELFTAGRHMLRANLESNWFGAGQFIRGATWLKIVYWNRDPDLSPLQTILRAYDDMPNVKQPDFLRA